MVVFKNDVRGISGLWELVRPVCLRIFVYQNKLLRVTCTPRLFLNVLELMGIVITACLVGEIRKDRPAKGGESTLRREGQWLVNYRGRAGGRGVAGLRSIESWEHR